MGFWSRLFAWSILFFGPSLAAAQVNIFGLPFTIEQRISQKTDHFSSKSLLNFQQRYFINFQYAKNELAPVLFEICGEQTCPGIFTSEIVFQAKRFGAVMIQMEHRYYGESLPFAEMTTQNLRFLTVSQALTDFASGHRTIMAQWNLSGSTIVVGCSYAGAMAAYLRSRYPDQIQGAWSSSAPVRAETFWTGNERFISEKIGKQCSMKYRDYFARVMSLSKKEKHKLKIKLHLDPRESDEDLIFSIDFFLNSIFRFSPQALCDSSREAEEILSAHAPTFAPLVRSFANQAAKNTQPSAGRAWLYQTCTQLGFFSQKNSSNPNSYLPPIFDRKAAAKSCFEVFGRPLRLGAHVFNRHFFEPIQNGKTSNILFVNGEFDPWSNLSITHPLPNHIEALQIKNGGHCTDYEGNWPASTDRDSTRGAISDTLREFGLKSATESANWQQK